MPRIKTNVRGLRNIVRMATRFRNPGKALRKSAGFGAETVLNLISKGFRKGTDPYGKSWNAPNKLQITGGIRAYAKSNVGEHGWTVHSTDEKAIWHHAPGERNDRFGKPSAPWRLPTRLQVPTTARGLPQKWARSIKRSVEEALHAYYKVGV